LVPDLSGLLERIHRFLDREEGDVLSELSAPPLLIAKR
jgi:hypothetical protein